MISGRTTWSSGRGQRQADAVEARLVGRVDVAAAGIIGGVGFLELLEDHRVVFEIVGLEVVGEVQFGRGAGLHADRGAGKLQRGVHARQLLGVDHEALAVIIGDAGEVEAERGVAVDRPGGVARQDVDFARLQRGEAVLGGERRELHLGAVAEDRGGDRAAEIDVEAGPFALVVRRGEAGEAGVDAALHEALCLDVVERGGGSGRSRHAERGRAENDLHSVFHNPQTLFCCSGPVPIVPCEAAHSRSGPFPELRIDSPTQCCAPIHEPASKAIIPVRSSGMTESATVWKPCAAICLLRRLCAKDLTRRTCRLPRPDMR